MSTLQTLRNTHVLARFVLVWFVLFMGVAVASSLVKPEASQLVCSAAGSIKLVQADTDAEGQAVPMHSALDCPACLPLIAPPEGDVVAHLLPQNLAQLFIEWPSPDPSSLPGQAWQARAPPSV